jgi:hypothetical protein
VFADKGEDDKAKQHTRWLTSSLISARVKGEQWCLVEFDGVLKQCVLDQEVNDGKTLNKDLARNFKADDGCETADRTEMKVTWLSKVDSKKKSRIDGSLAEEQSGCRVPTTDRHSHVRRD